MRCSEVQEVLPAYVRNGEQPLEVRRHLSRCSACKAELARYESLLQDLGALAARSVEPPADLLPALVVIPADAGRFGVLRDQVVPRVAAMREEIAPRVAATRRHVARNRSRYVGGAAVAVAGLAGAAVLNRRRRMAPA